MGDESRLPSFVVVVTLVVLAGLTVQSRVVESRAAFASITILMCIGLVAVKRILGDSIVSSTVGAVRYTVVYSTLLYTLKYVVL